jgi:DNA polymerase
VTELQLVDAEVRACTRCRLAQTRKRAVPGEGSPTATVLFVGEGPGFWEDEQGRPFVGPAGQLLNELLQLIGMRREDVYITNVVKCRPPGNRDPLPDEIGPCGDFLTRQIALIQPRLIVTLGRFSMARFFPPGKSMKDLHGKTVVHDGTLCLAMYHPAAVLRQPSLRPVVEADFRRIPELLAQAEVEERREGTPEPEQLSLF